MVIREIGVMVRGFPLVYSSYPQTGENIDVVLRSGLLSGILIFYSIFLKKMLFIYMRKKSLIEPILAIIYQFRANLIKYLKN